MSTLVFKIEIFCYEKNNKATLVCCWGKKKTVGKFKEKDIKHSVLGLDVGLKHAVSFPSMV